jgi:hypothetical protein
MDYHHFPRILSPYPRSAPFQQVKSIFCMVKARCFAMFHRQPISIPHIPQVFPGFPQWKWEPNEPRSSGYGGWFLWFNEFHRSAVIVTNQLASSHDRSLRCGSTRSGCWERTQLTQARWSLHVLWFFFSIIQETMIDCDRSWDEHSRCVWR